MRTLHVVYREDDGSVSEELLRGFLPGTVATSAVRVCDPDGFMKQLQFDRVVRAADLDTGELIDLRELCGGAPPPGPPPALLPRLKQRPRLQHTEDDTATKARRRIDREEFLRSYGCKVIWNHFYGRLIALFNGRCFACGAPAWTLDHHVPLNSGGRREAGNIVLLCISCNSRKQDAAPELFYSADELINLAPLLERQKEILSFQFNAKRWNEDPVKYLLEVGISPLLIHEITTNPEHDWYLPIDPTTRRVAMPDFSDAALHDGLASSAPELPELPEFVDTSIQRVAIVHDSGEIHLCVVRLPDVLLTAPNPSFFYGYCETCQRFESFQYGRVLKVIDLLTRKDVPSLHERAKEIYAAGPWEAFKAFMHQHRLILEVAAYVGRSARTNRNRLNEVLISFIRNKFDDLRLPDMEIEKVVRTLGRHSFETFSHDTEELAKQGAAEIETALALANRVKAIRGKTTAQVQSVLDGLVSRNPESK